MNILPIFYTSNLLPLSCKLALHPSHTILVHFTEQQENRDLRIEIVSGPGIPQESMNLKQPVQLCPPLLSSRNQFQIHLFEKASNI